VMISFEFVAYLSMDPREKGKENQIQNKRKRERRP
jgi:hypothetical protein